MAITIGRLGYLGWGIETTPGTAVGASVYLPYTDISLREHHEPIEDIASKASRIMDKSSVGGKKWGEGDVSINLDVVNSGYLFKCALGSELLATGTPNDHTFYPTVSGNTPTTATMLQGRGDTDYLQYAFGAIDELSMEVSDGLGTLSASIMSAYPTQASASTPTTTSGTVFAFKDYTVQFGADISAAEGASTTPINELSLSIANNLEVIHRSGSQDVSTIRNKGLRITGSYTVFFDSGTDRDNYTNLFKKAMVITFTGNNDEELRIRIPQFRLNEAEISTGIDDFFVTKCDWVAEDVLDSGTRLIDIRLQNSKSSAY